MIISERLPEYYVRPAHEIRHCVIVYYHDSTLTDSVYVLHSRSHAEALHKAENHFFQKAKYRKYLMRFVSRIEVLPKNSERYSGKPPVITKDYPLEEITV